MWLHWVARTLAPETPLRDFNHARWMWTRLAEGFPDAVAVVLMPNHIHLILPIQGNPPSEVPLRLGGVLGALTRRLKKEKLWQPIPRPANIPDIFHLKRQIRYLALNPCRKQLCPDPLSWYWSTYREIVGATAESTDRSNKLAAILGNDSKQFKVRFHSYVSGDPSVLVQGSPFPKPATTSEIPQYAIGQILNASAAALRVHPSEVRRKSRLRFLFIHMAYKYGWESLSLLSKICEVSPSAIHKSLKKNPRTEEILAAELCLGDPRLISHPNG